MNIKKYFGFLTFALVCNMLNGALVQTGHEKTNDGMSEIRGYLLTEFSDLRLLVSKSDDLDRRIKQSVCLVDSTGGMSQERGVEIHVECDTTLRKVLDLVPFRREVTPGRIRVFQRDRIIQYKSDVDECGRHVELTRFYETVIGRGDVIAICALR